MKAKDLTTDQLFIFKYCTAYSAKYMASSEPVYSRQASKHLILNVNTQSLRIS